MMVTRGTPLLLGGVAPQGLQFAWHQEGGSAKGLSCPGGERFVLHVLPWDIR